MAGLIFLWKQPTGGPGFTPGETYHCFRTEERPEFKVTATHREFIFASQPKIFTFEAIDRIYKFKAIDRQYSFKTANRTFTYPSKPKIKK